jgi:hypothetical protein
MKKDTRPTCVGNTLSNTPKNSLRMTPDGISPSFAWWLVESDRLKPLYFKVVLIKGK